MPPPTLRSSSKPQEKDSETRQCFRIEDLFDLGDQLLEGTTLWGNALGNFEGDGILHGLGLCMDFRGP